MSVDKIITGKDCDAITRDSMASDSSCDSSSILTNVTMRDLNRCSKLFSKFDSVTIDALANGEYFTPIYDADFPNLGIRSERYRDRMVLKSLITNIPDHSITGRIKHYTSKNTINHIIAYVKTYM